MFRLFYAALVAATALPTPVIIVARHVEMPLSC